jgi:hypothetical protein
MARGIGARREFCSVPLSRCVEVEVMFRRSQSRSAILKMAVTAAFMFGSGTNAAWAADDEPGADQTRPAQDPGTEVAALQVESNSMPVSASGQIAVKDKTTGKLRAPTAEEAAELSKASAQQPAGRAAAPEVRVSASGVMSATLGEEYENYEVAGIGADGKLVRDCVDGSQEAQDRLKTPPAALEKE